MAAENWTIQMNKETAIHRYLYWNVWYLNIIIISNTALHLRICILTNIDCHLQINFVLSHFRSLNSIKLKIIFYIYNFHKN